MQDPEKQLREHLHGVEAGARTVHAARDRHSIPLKLRGIAAELAGLPISGCSLHRQTAISSLQCIAGAVTICRFWHWLSVLMKQGTVAEGWLMSCPLTCSQVYLRMNVAEPTSTAQLAMQLARESSRHWLAPQQPGECVCRLRTPCWCCLHGHCGTRLHNLLHSKNELTGSKEGNDDCAEAVSTDTATPCLASGVGLQHRTYAIGFKLGAAREGGGGGGGRRSVEVECQ